MSDEPALRDLLHCPETHRPLLAVAAKWVDRLNARIRAGELHTEGGEVVEETIDDGLITEDDQFLYPIRDGVPNMSLHDRICLHDE